MNQKILVLFALCFVFTVETFSLTTTINTLLTDVGSVLKTVLGNVHDNDKTVTYRITKYSKKISDEDVDNIIARAFDEWSKHANINFQRTDNSADISLSFETLDHGDGFAFDGPGGVLGHAFKKQVHFDDDENWRADDEGTNLYSVAVHEIGHVLGLGHTDVEGSIMFP